MLGPKPRAETTIGIKVVLEPKKKLKREIFSLI